MLVIAGDSKAEPVQKNEKGKEQHRSWLFIEAQRRIFGLYPAAGEKVAGSTR